MLVFKVVKYPTGESFTVRSTDIRAVMLQAEEKHPNGERPTGWMRYPDNAPHILGGHRTAACCAWMRRMNENQTVAIDRWVQYEVKDMLMHPTGLIIYRTD